MTTRLSCAALCFFAYAPQAFAESEEDPSCQEQQSQFDLNVCVDRKEKKANDRRHDAIDELSKAWPKNQQAALLTLQKAAETYFHSNAKKEQDQEAAIHIVVYLSRMSRLRDHHLALLQRLAKETPLAHAKEDSGVQAADIDAHALPNISEANKETQLLWEVYRDAWFRLLTMRLGEVTTAWRRTLYEDRNTIIMAPDVFK